MRASDAERDVAADRLREAAAEGRVDTDELEERVAEVYRARTRRDLETLTADLPRAPAVVPPVPAPWRSPAVRHRLASFITVNVTCIAIWLATGASASFWPIWVLLFTGLGLFSTLVRGALGVGDRDRDDRRHRHHHRPRL